jgi:probable phosphoglycerate mutase
MSTIVASEVVLVRHGQTEWSRDGLHTGRTDIPLTEIGRRQADQLASMLHDRVFALAISSPLERARATAERACLDVAVEISDDLLEWDYGIYEGVTTDAVRRDIPDWSVWTHPIIDGETLDEVGHRADSVIERVLRAGSTVLFAHGHFLRILAARWLGQSPETGRLLALDTATISALGFERENRVIRRWNEGCHLRGIESPW